MTHLRATLARRRAVRAHLREERALAAALAAAPTPAPPPPPPGRGPPRGGAGPGRRARRPPAPRVRPRDRGPPRPPLTAPLPWSGRRCAGLGLVGAGEEEGRWHVQRRDPPSHG